MLLWPPLALIRVTFPPLSSRSWPYTLGPDTSSIYFRLHFGSRYLFNLLQIAALFELLAPNRLDEANRTVSRRIGRNAVRSNKVESDWVRDRRDEELCRG